MELNPKSKWSFFDFLCHLSARVRSKEGLGLVLLNMRKRAVQQTSLNSRNRRRKKKHLKEYRDMEFLNFSPLFRRSFFAEVFIMCQYFCSVGTPDVLHDIILLLSWETEWKLFKFYG